MQNKWQGTFIYKSIQQLKTIVRLRSRRGDIAQADDLVSVLSVNISQDGIQHGQIAVNVGKNSDIHTDSETLKAESIVRQMCHLASCMVCQ